MFLSANVVYMDREGDPVLSDEVSSQTIGDTNGHPGRQPGGSANGVGGAGGFVNGNAYPAEPPYVRVVEPTVGRRYPPWVVWEGDLVQGDHALVVAPSIWEWDGGRDAFGDWSAWLPKAVAKIGEEVKKYTKGGTVVDTVIESVQAGLGIASSMNEAGLLGQAQDRPIGMVEVTPATSPRSYGFSPKLLVLNYDRAEALLKTSLLGVPGLRAFEYRDDPRYQGHYTVYVRLEKLGKAKDLKPDHVPPSASAAATVQVGKGSAIVSWSGKDPDLVNVARSGVKGFDLRIRNSRIGTTWKTVLKSTTRSRYVLTGRIGQRYQYSVRATDRAANRGAWTVPKTVALR